MCSEMEYRKKHFSGFQEYNDFRKRWIRVCARLNRKGKNAQILCKKVGDGDGQGNTEAV